jgi:hypothetical protein
MLLRYVDHWNRFAFHPQSQSLAKAASLLARVSEPSHLRRNRNSGGLKRTRLVGGDRWNWFRFPHRLKSSVGSRSLLSLGHEIGRFPSDIFGFGLGEAFRFPFRVCLFSFPEKLQDHLGE